MTSNSSPTTVLHAAAVSKAFGSVVANEAVDLEIRSGEIHAVVGENGAGKTTLMRMLSGEIAPDSGEITVHGRPARFRSPRDATRAGIGMVHQHYSVVAGFSLVDNLLLGVPGRSARALPAAELERARTFLEQEGFTDPARTTISDLSVDDVQRFEIARLLFVGADILILDEPTAVLGPIEIDRLYARLRDLATGGKAVVVITHKLAEVEQHADRVTVMRRGTTVFSAAGTQSRDLLVREMFGSHTQAAERQEALQREHVEQFGSDVVLEVESLSVRAHDGRARVQDLSFEVRAGEVLCVVGVEGNGQSYLMDALAGLRAADGTIRVAGQDVTSDTPRGRFHHGVRFVSEDRHRWDVITSATVTENLLAHRYADGRALGRTESRGPSVTEVVLQALRRFDVRPAAPRLRLGALSGGNQQRAVVARESLGEKKVLLLSHPTRGLDVVGAARIIEDALEQRSKGVAIVWNTADLDEAYAVADRFLVMFRGQLSYLGDRADTTRDDLAVAMAGSVVS